MKFNKSTRKQQKKWVIPIQNTSDTKQNPSPLRRFNPSILFLFSRLFFSRCFTRLVEKLKDISTSTLLIAEKSGCFTSTVLVVMKFQVVLALALAALIMVEASKHGAKPHKTFKVDHRPHLHNVPFKARVAHAQSRVARVGTSLSSLSDASFSEFFSGVTQWSRLFNRIPLSFYACLSIHHPWTCQSCLFLLLWIQLSLYHHSLPLSFCIQRIISDASFTATLMERQFV